MELLLGPHSPGDRVTGEAHKLSTPITKLSHKYTIFIYMEKGRRSLEERAYGWHFKQRGQYVQRHGGVKMLAVRDL